MTIIKPYFSFRAKLKLGLDEIIRYAEVDAQKFVLDCLASILEQGFRAGAVVEGKEFVENNAKFMERKPGGRELREAYLAVVQGREGHPVDDFVDFVCRFSDDAVDSPFDSAKEVSVLNKQSLSVSEAAKLVSSERKIDDAVFEAVADKFDREDSRAKNAFVLDVFYARLRLHAKNTLDPPGAFMAAIGETAAHLGDGLEGIDVAAYRYFVDVLRALVQCAPGAKRHFLVATEWMDQIVDAARPFVNERINKMRSSMQRAALVYLGQSFEYETATISSKGRIDDSDPSRPKLLFR